MEDTQIHGRQPRVSVVTVTHNSDAFLRPYGDALRKQSYSPHRVILVDSGSSDLRALQAMATSGQVEVEYAGKNIGFSAANNIGTKRSASDSEYLVYLNPDAFLSPPLIEQAVAFMEEPGNEDVACLTGILLGFVLAANGATGLIDSTGIFRTWYGRWYDRGQGEPAETGRYAKVEEVPAICGALMFVRRAAIEQLLEKDGFVFDESFFMYKEDIDLSLRLRKLGWRLVYHPGLIAYHCRGWSKSRASVPRALRLLSARNEVRLCKKHSFWFLPYAYLKLALVWAFDI